MAEWRCPYFRWLTPQEVELWSRMYVQHVVVFNGSSVNEVKQTKVKYVTLLFDIPKHLQLACARNFYNVISLNNNNNFVFMCVYKRKHQEQQT